MFIMKFSNITIKVDADLAHEAKVFAARQGVSLSRLVAEQLERLVREDQAFAAARAVKIQRTCPQGIGQPAIDTAALAARHYLEAMEVYLADDPEGTLHRLSWAEGYYANRDLYRWMELDAALRLGDVERVRRMSLIEEGDGRRVRMANLACAGSHTVNGVAELHSRLLREGLFRDFAELWPERFNNKTNGVTQRRWLAWCNRPLRELLEESIRIDPNFAMAHAYKAAVDANLASGRTTDDGVSMGLFNYPVLMAADIVAFGLYIDGKWDFGNRQFNSLAPGSVRTVMNVDRIDVPWTIPGGHHTLSLNLDYLEELDEIAYVRFASVYRSFRDLNQFMDELRVLLERRSRDGLAEES